jgi:HD-like signal output (HDOD) protein
VKHVLFVDDEQQILDGLRNVMRKHRSSWETTFVSSGAAALEHLASHGVDVVVSDMRMPEMDGAQLLTLVRELYPATARIVLTGQASRSDLLRVLPIAQQILSKPCDPNVLSATIERTCKAQALLSNPKLQALVGGLDSLPTFPKCYQLLSEVMQRDDATVADIARIVEQDAGLSVKSLAMANAAYFGLGQPTTSIPAAVRHIGFALLRALALSTDIFGEIDSRMLVSSSLRNLPDHSLLKAQLAKSFVTDRSLADEAFTAALMLDIGMIVLARRLPDTYLQILACAEEGPRPLQEIELEQLGFTHAEVGAYLLGMWGLPPGLLEIVASHHLPALIEISENPIAAAVHLADLFADPARLASPDPTADIAAPIRERADVQHFLPEWLALARKATGSC